MKIQSFKSFIGATHEIALSRALDTPININGGKGIDLIDSKKGVEVKGCLINPKSSGFKKRYAKWTLFDYQLTWNEKYDVPLYCAIGTYRLNSPISRIRSRNLKRLEEHVTQREFWVVPWNWTIEFPIRKGEYHDYRYLRKNPHPSTGIPPIPKINYTKSIPKGLLHFTKGVNKEHFLR